MLPEKFLIENRLEESKKSKPIVNPYSGGTVAEVFVPDDEQYNRSVNYLVEAYNKYKNVPVYIKSELLYKISHKISERKDRLAELITTETGKPIKFSKVEIGGTDIPPRCGRGFPDKRRSSPARFTERLGKQNRHSKTFSNRINPRHYTMELPYKPCCSQSIACSCFIKRNYDKTIIKLPS